MTASITADQVELLVGGRVYAGWTDLRVTRAMDRVAGDFSLSVSERWPGQSDPWRILPYDAIELRLGGDVILTGYVDSIEPDIDASRHTVRIAGRSKTGQLVDCTPELSGTEFRGSSLPAIARALAAPFGVQVVVNVPDGRPFGVEAADPTNSAWQTIERLARLRGVLAHDDEQGRLVLSRAGTARAAGTLELGRNMLSASARLSGAKRFSRYITLAQRQTAAAVARDNDGDASDSEEAQRPAAGVQVGVRGVAIDPGVPLYRPSVMRAEGAQDPASAHERALWAAATARARALQATVRVQGWRAADRRLWKLNELVHVRAPALRLDHDLLIIEAEFTLNDAGRVTELTLVPPDALLPEPLPDAVRAPGAARPDPWQQVQPGSGRL